MNEKQLNEVTNGTFGCILWKNCFSVKMEGDYLIIRAPFKKAILPFEYIDKVSSSKTLKTNGAISYAVSGTYLKIEHHYNEAPKDIYFLTEKDTLWSEVFRNKNIQIDIIQSDAKEPQESDKIATSIMQVMGIVVVIASLVVAIIAIVRTRG